MKKYKLNVKDKENLFTLLVSNPAFRLDMSLIGGLIMNSVYIIENLISAIAYRSLWAATVGVYYSLIVAIRGYLLSARDLEDVIGAERVNLYRVCRRVGLILLLSDFAAAAMMFYAVSLGRVIYYSDLVLLGFVFYTVYALLSSLIGIIRSVKKDTPLKFAARNTTFAAALLSIFNLQYSVFAFVDAPAHVVSFFNIAGGVISFSAMILLALWLIIKSTVRINE